MKKKLLWILWTPLILIGLLGVVLLTVFFIGSYSVEYGPDEYAIAVAQYDNTNVFYVTNEYELVVTDTSLLPIAEKCNGYIEKIYGQPLQITDKTSDKPFISLIVDENANDNIVYSSDNTNITVTADNKDHLLRGMYAFLEEFGGVRCYTSKQIDFTADKIFFPQQDGGYTQTYNDYFEMRDTDWISPKDDEYAWFRGFNTDEYRYFVENQQSDETAEEATARITEEVGYYNSLGGRSQYISGFCHTFTSDFLDSSKYYDNGLYLECYALDGKGNRRRDELCLSNPKTLEIVTEEVFAILENRRETDRVYGTYYDPEAPLQIISLTQSDDLTGCKCADCVKCAKEHGGYSAPNLLFVNAIAQAVKDAGYDNVAIDTFAYRYTRSAPTDIVPLDNVIIRLCSIECCSSHYIDDENCLSNKAFMEDLADWSKICDRIYIWDYCSDFAYFTTVFPNIHTLAHNLRVFYEHNVKGVYEEGNYTIPEDASDAEFAELRAYVISKVMQNPYCDYEAVMKDFCNAYYGEAGEDMYNFVLQTDTYAGRRHLNIYKSPRMILSCSDEELTQLNDLFEHAKSVATGTAADNVRHSELCWRYYKMYNKLFEFAKSGTFEVAKEYLYMDFGKAKTARFHEFESNYPLSGIAQTAIVDLRPLFDFVVGNFIYGP